LGEQAQALVAPVEALSRAPEEVEQGCGHAEDDDRAHPHGEGHGLAGSGDDDRVDDGTETEREFEHEQPGEARFVFGSSSPAEGTRIPALLPPARRSIRENSFSIAMASG